MRTVSSIIKHIYGDDAAAAKAHNVGTSAIWNWRANGVFPALRLPKLLTDAQKKGVELGLSDVPLAKRRATACAA